MKTMGLQRLCLVQAKSFPDEVATAMAVAASDVLDAAEQFNALPDAVADCHLVIGTSARSRHLRWPVLSPTEAAQKIAQLKDPYQAAVVFGRESSGLSNSELDLCQYLVHIPCNPEFRSLNLASAVQIVAYEIAQHTLRLSIPEDTPATISVADMPASSQELEHFFVHLETALVASSFLKNRQATSLLRRLRKLFQRTQLTQREVNILRGMIQALLDKSSSEDA